MIKSNKTKPTAKSGGRKLKNDIILLVTLVCAITILALCLYFFGKDATSVVITIDGKVYATYSIEDDITVDITTGETNENVNRLVITGGEAYISYASCPDGICAAHKPISYSGESIICLPHKLVVSTVSNNKNTVTPDIVS